MTGPLEDPFESDARGVTAFATAAKSDRLDYLVCPDCDPIDGSPPTSDLTRSPGADWSRRSDT